MDQKIAKKIDDFFSQFPHQTYRKGEILIRADEDPKGIFYLKEGAVKKYQISKKGEELVLNMYKPISFFPMSYAMNGTPNIYYYEALTTCEIWRAPKEKAVAFVKENPDVLYDLLRRVYIGIDGMMLRMAYLMSGSAYGRLITELLISAKRFGDKINGGTNTIALQLSQKDIATHAGITRETVSRGIKILKEKGLIELQDKRMLIKNLDDLEEELVAAD